ncbi:transposase [Ornithinimicrobium panacihumi]|uniref:transposase n=1 Tax=Ornithinimicrobium panacihumi TaxID=2008449 RepID=UPI003F8AB2E2
MLTINLLLGRRPGTYTDHLTPPSTSAPHGRAPCWAAPVLVTTGPRTRHRPVRRRPGGPANKLTETERAHVLAVLTSEELADKAVAQAWATLLDEGTYLCSQSTMHRILRENDLAGERRRQATHPARTRPELLATAPGQVWSWDITKLKGPDRGVYYDLYVVLDIFSRFVVAWTIAAGEDAQIATNLLEHAMGVHGVPDAVHADRGTSMTSKPVAQLLVDLGVARSHSRPHVSNDNPYSEAAFKTLKYAPVFPERFGSLATPARSPSSSSPTTTTSTATPGSGCTPPPASTTPPRARSVPNARPPWTRSTPLTPSASATADPRRPICPRPRGSTSPHRRPSYRPPDGNCLTRLDTFRPRAEGGPAS